MTHTSPATIRVHNYCGDRDDLNDVNIIGPYPTPADRDRDIQRLTDLPDVHGNLTFAPSQHPPAGVDHSCTADDVATATDLNGVLAALRIILP